MSPPSIHASCVLVGEGAILIRGPSGTGKSGLSLALIAAARREGRLARLIGDDRIVVSAEGSRVIARGLPSIAGRIEVRGVGMLPAESEPAGVVRLVVDLVADEESRLPTPERSMAELCGVALPHVTCRIRAGLETVLLERYRALNDTLMIE